MVTSKDIARRNKLQAACQNGTRLTQKQKDELNTLSMDIAEVSREVYLELLAEIN